MRPAQSVAYTGILSAETLVCKCAILCDSWPTWMFLAQEVLEGEVSVFFSLLHSGWVLQLQTLYPSVSWHALSSLTPSIISSMDLILVQLACSQLHQPPDQLWTHSGLFVCLDTSAIFPRMADFPQWSTTHLTCGGGHQWIIYFLYIFS